MNDQVAEQFNKRRRGSARCADLMDDSARQRSFVSGHEKVRADAPGKALETGFFSRLFEGKPDHEMMTRTKGVEIGILVSTTFRKKEAGRRFLKLLLAEAPEYAPERYSDHEPIRVPFDRTNLDDALKCWPMSFVWRAKRASIWGGAYSGFHRVHDSVVLRMPASVLDTEVVLRLTRAMQSAFGVDLAFLHVRTDIDTLDTEHYKRHLMPFQTLNTHHLREGLPDMPWAMLFGPPYVELFSRERLVSTPGARIETIGDGVYVQLTGDPSDVAKKRDEYLAAQRAAKEHLDHDAFRGMSREKCRVPERFLVAP